MFDEIFLNTDCHDGRKNKTKIIPLMAFYRHQLGMYKLQVTNRKHYIQQCHHDWLIYRPISTYDNIRYKTKQNSASFLVATMARLIG